MSYQVTCQPEKYPPPPGVSTKTTGEAKQLSTTFALDIFRGLIEGSACVPTAPILHVVRYSSEYRPTNLLSCGVRDDVKRVTIEAADGMGNIVPIKVATQNNGHIGVLREGDIIVLRHLKTLIVDYAKENKKKNSAHFYTKNIITVLLYFV